MGTLTWTCAHAAQPKSREVSKKQETPEPPLSWAGRNAILNTTTRDEHKKFIGTMVRFWEDKGAKVKLRFPGEKSFTIKGSFTLLPPWKFSLVYLDGEEDSSRDPCL